MQIVVKDRKAKQTVAMQDLSDPDSLEAKVKESVTYKKLKPDPEPVPEPVVQAPPPRDGDVLEIFEEDMSKEKVTVRNAMLERARGVADESEVLLSPEELQVDVAVVAPVAKPAEKATVAVAAEPAKPAAVERPVVVAPAANMPEPVVAEPLPPAAESSTVPTPVTNAPEPLAAEPLAPVVKAQLLLRPP
jgi:hypothetical protein